MRASFRAALVGLAACAVACSGGGHGGSPASRRPSSAPASGANSSSQPQANPEPGFGVTAASVPARAKRGEVVTVSFHARPGSTCQLTLAGAKQAQQPVLAPAVVDPTGQVSWTWRLSSTLKPGSVTAWTACSGGAVGQARITIS